MSSSTISENPNISLLIPIYNEEPALPSLFLRLDKLIAELSDFRWEIMFVNDGSTDSGLHLIKEKQQKDERFRYVDLSRNFGKEIAMMAGLDYVTGDCVVILDADLQDPPEVIEKMISLWEQGYDDVYGRRKSRGKESWLRRNLSLLYYRLLQRTTDIPVLQNTGDFRLLDRVCINALRSMRETQRYSKGLFCWIGFRKAEVLFDRGDRSAGCSKWNFFKLFRLAVEGITCYTTVPLRIATIVGFFSSFCSFLAMIYFVAKTLIWGDPVQGFPSLVSIFLFIGGLILLSLGILGEYIGRIFMETKRRPAYFVREVDGSRNSVSHVFQQKNDEI